MTECTEISREEALALLKPELREELRKQAHEMTGRCVDKRFDFCSIINARSGRWFLDGFLFSPTELLS